MADMTNTVSLSLIKRNREIAKCRDDLIKADKTLDATQAKNSTLLEELSILDAEVTQQCIFAANSEQKLAELFERKRSRESELKSAQADGDAKIATLRSEMVRHLDAQEILKSELSEERRRSEDQQASDAQLATLTEDLAHARERREVLEESISRATIEQNSEIARLQVLESQVANLGGDACAVLRTVGASSPTSTEVVESSSCLDSLQQDLRASEEHRASLQASLALARDESGKANAGLRVQLDNARDELQQSMASQAEVHRSRVATLEEEIEAAVTRAREESAIAKACEDERLDVQSATARAEEDQEAQLAESVEADRWAELEHELEEIQSENRAQEAALRRCQEEASTAEQRRQDVQRQGAKNASQTRAAIEELWRALKTVNP